MVGMSASATPMFAGGQKLSPKTRKPSGEAGLFSISISNYIIAHLRGQWTRIWNFILHFDSCVCERLLCFSLLTCKKYMRRHDSSCTTLEKWTEMGITGGALRWLAASAIPNLPHPASKGRVAL